MSAGLLRIQRSTPLPKSSRDFLIAAALLVLALALPWWTISMVAPQYPFGLHVTTRFFAVSGDVHEVDELNHYIGFMPLGTIAGAERASAYVLGPAMVLALLAAALVRERLGAFLAVPAVALPVIFVADLGVWLFYAGHHLDPHAALSSSVSPWTPSLLGPGGVGQFHTESLFGLGFYCAIAAAVAAVAGMRARRAENRAEHPC